MAILEHHGLGGRLTMILCDRSGRVLERRRANNIITTEGKMLLAKYLGGIVFGEPKLAIAVGGNGDEHDESYTRLKDEDAKLAEEPAGKPVIRIEDGTRRVVATVTATLPATGEDLIQELKEAGIIITPPDGDPVLYNRTTFPVVTRTGNMQMTLTWELLF